MPALCGEHISEKKTNPKKHLTIVLLNLVYQPYLLGFELMMS